MWGPSTYRDMHLLNELAHSPDITQRALARRIGAALGLTNLMLRRLATKGYIKITGTKRSRIRYLITPKGILEKTRLTYEFIQYSLQLYGGVRSFLRERLAIAARAGQRRILLCGTDELAEIAFLTVREMGLEVVGVMDAAPRRSQFLGYPVYEVSETPRIGCDQILITSLRSEPELLARLTTLGVPSERIIKFTQPGLLSARASASPSTEDSAKELRPSATDVVVLCGGRGTRLGSLTGETPKPLLMVGEHPFLLHVLLRLRQEGFRRIILAAHYRAERFQEFLSNYSERLPGVQLLVEPEPLGTGGAVRYAADAVQSTTCVVVNGDSWVRQPLGPVLRQHAQARRACTVVAVPAGHVEGGALNKGVWHVGPQDEVLGFATQEAITEGWVNAGVYVLEHALVASWPKGAYSLEANLPSLLSGHRAGVFCSGGWLLDIGTPECYEKAQHLLAPGGAPAPALSLLSADG